MSEATVAAADFQELLSEYGEDITYRGSGFSLSIKCAPGEVTEQNDRERGGVLDQAEASINIAVADLSGNMPKSGDFVSFRSQDYKVIEAQIDPLKVFYSCLLMSRT